MPTAPGRHGKPVSPLVHKVRELGWEPKSPTEWVTGEGVAVDAHNLELTTLHVRPKLGSLRWERLAGRRPDFQRAERGVAVDEAATFQGPRATLGGKDQTAFGRYACILSGDTWTATRRMAAGYGGNGCCQICPSVLESPLHKWWQCPRWGRIRKVDGRDLEAEACRANFEPRCLWECGVLPAPEPGDVPVPAVPPAAPSEAEPGDGTIERGATIYTDASAIRPKDLP